jgi:hypothetical protein
VTDDTIVSSTHKRADLSRRLLVKVYGHLVVVVFEISIELRVSEVPNKVGVIIGESDRGDGREKG